MNISTGAVCVSSKVHSCECCKARLSPSYTAWIILPFCGPKKERTRIYNKRMSVKHDSLCKLQYNISQRTGWMSQLWKGLWFTRVSIIFIIAPNSWVVGPWSVSLTATSAMHDMIVWGLRGPLALLYRKACFTCQYLGWIEHSPGSPCL